MAIMEELQVDLEATKRVTVAVLDAVTPILKEFQQQGDREALIAAGNTLIMLGTSMLRSQVGQEGASEILEEIVQAMSTGGLAEIFGLPEEKN
jgi:hypothetical protein